MGGMAWGKKRQMAKAQTAPRPTTGSVPDVDSDADERHSCCICAVCNRTRNDGSTMFER